MGKEVKRRNPRTTRAQIELMVDFVCDNKHIFFQNKHDLRDIDMHDIKWAELTELLNSCNGPTKTMKQWKRALIEYKTSVRRKFRQYNLDTVINGKDSVTAKQLNKTEQQLLDALSSASIDGIELQEVLVQDNEYSQQQHSPLEENSNSEDIPNLVKNEEFFVPDEDNKDSIHKVEMDFVEVVGNPVTPTTNLMEQDTFDIFTSEHQPTLQTNVKTQKSTLREEKRLSRIAAEMKMYFKHNERIISEQIEINRSLTETLRNLVNSSRKTRLICNPSYKFNF